MEKTATENIRIYKSGQKETTTTTATATAADDDADAVTIKNTNADNTDNTDNADSADSADNNIINFFRIRDPNHLKLWLNKNSITLVGIEIMDDAITLNDDKIFQTQTQTASGSGSETGSIVLKTTTTTTTKRIAFMPGNEGTGLSQTQKDICDKFVVIPHYGTATASLNVHVATCLVLYRYNSYLKNIAIESDILVDSKDDILNKK